MHHPGEDNIPLMRTHQELVRYESSEDDTYNLVVETLAEKLSELLQNESTDEGESYPPNRSLGFLLPSPSEPSAVLPPTEVEQGDHALA
jgi:hypothetical protein